MKTERTYARCCKKCSKMFQASGKYCRVCDSCNNSKNKVKFLGYRYFDKPSPHRIAMFFVEEGATLEDIDKCSRKEKS